MCLYHVVSHHKGTVHLFLARSPFYQALRSSDMFWKDITAGSIHVGGWILPAWLGHPNDPAMAFYAWCRVPGLSRTIKSISRWKNTGRQRSSLYKTKAVRRKRKTESFRRSRQSTAVYYLGCRWNQSYNVPVHCSCTIPVLSWNWSIIIHNGYIVA